MAFGIATWDAQGRPNNYGIKPVSVIGRIHLAEGQKSGAWSFPVSAGMKVGYVVALDKGAVGPGRRITASGNTITVSAASAVGGGVYSASECDVIVFVERA